jgi:transposase InsO family protein
MCGRWTSHIFRWRAALSIWQQSWTGHSTCSAWRLSITLEMDFASRRSRRRLARTAGRKFSTPIHGSQFTSASFTGLLLDNKIAISMDGRGSWRDNVFVERLWRSVKYEDVYLGAYDNVGDARASLGRYLVFCNALRPDSTWTHARRITPTSILCHTRRQPEFRRHHRVVAPFGLRPSCSTAR